MNNYMILCDSPIINFSRWNQIYELTRQNKNNKTFGYGIRVNTEDYADLEEIRKVLPFRDHFFFLISNKRNREFPIHVDGVPNDKNAASVNWPLLRCDERSPTIWYSCDQIKFKDLDNSFFLENVDDAVEIYREPMYSKFELPYLFRGELLHKGYCNIDENGFRIIVKWELDYNTWEDAVNGFQNRNIIKRR